MTNAFSVDLEDYFHPTELACDPSKWTTLPARVEIGTNLLLDLLAEHQARATFFVLGWVAERHPGLVARVAQAGHEIGCHSYEHRLVYSLTPQQFRDDTSRAIRCIEDACGVIPRLYRAPSYSVTPKSYWALEILADLGFSHDSSIYPIVHDRYGIPDFPRHAQTVSTPSGPIMEVPIATAMLPFGRVTPVGGGAYLRLFPYRYTAAGIRRLNNLDREPACIYTHPWELDPGHPRMTKSAVSSLRTYTGLRTMARKLNHLFRDFRFAALGDVYPTTVSPT